MMSSGSIPLDGLSLESFESLVRGQAPALRRALLSLTRGRADEADDLLQRTFVCAWRKRETYRGPDALAWLKGIARQELRVSLRAYSRRSRLREALAQELEEEASPDHDSSAELWDCLRRLGRLERQIVALHYALPGLAEDGSFVVRPLEDAEIATGLSIEGGPFTPARVKMRRHRALKQLRECIERKRSPAPDRGASKPLEGAPDRALIPAEASMRHNEQLEEDYPMASGAEDAHVSDEDLLELLETNGGGTELETVQGHVARCTVCRGRLREFARLELDLAVLALDGVLEGEPGGGPEAVAHERPLETLPEEQVKAILRESGATPEQMPRLALLRSGGLATLSSSSSTKRAAFPWRPATALAAVVLLGWGMWTWTALLKSSKQHALVEEASGTGGVQYRGEAEGQRQPPAVVVVKPPNTEPEARSPTQKGIEVWEVEVPARASMQLFVQRPPGATTWSVAVTCSRPGGDALSLTPGGGAYSAEGDGTDAELALGRPLNLEAAGLTFGAVVVCEVRRAGKLEWLRVRVGD